MAVIKDRNSPTGWQRFFRISTFKSSSDPKQLSVSRSYPNDGSSNAPSHGSIAADDSPRIGEISTAGRSHSCALLQSASCSEKYAIRPKLSGQTLSIELLDEDDTRGAIATCSCPCRTAIAASTNRV